MHNIHTIDLYFQQIPHVIAAFLIETIEGPILIETGPHTTLPYLSKGINDLGYQLEDIRHVFLSHIHLDHAGAAWVFAQKGAKIYLHPFGAKNMAKPFRLMESARMIYKDKMDALWGEMNSIPTNQLIEVVHKESITIGDLTLKSWHTPGHAKHHIAWQMDDIIFTGDIAGVKIDKGIVVPPCPPPDIDIEAWKNSTQLLRSLNPKQLYLTHFAEISDVNKHLDALDNILDNLAEWVKVHWEAGESNQDMVPKFMNHVVDQLKEAGLDDDEIKQYETANPSWMSVAGLVRYWKKMSKP